MFKIIKFLLIIVVIQVNVIYAAITLQNEVIINSDEILLSQLIKKNPDNIDLPDISFGNAPLSGRTRRLYKNQLKYRLSLHGFDEKIEIPDTIEVSRAYQLLDLEYLQAFVIQHIESVIKNDYDKFSIDIVRFNARTAQISTGDVAYNVRFNNKTELRGRIVGYLDIFVNNEPESVINFVVDIKAWQLLPVLLENVSYNDIITDTMIKEDLVDITRANISNVVTNKDEITLKMAKRRINEGSIINKNSLSEPFAVENRSLVNVIVNQDGFIIKTTARAMQSGVIGEKIRLLNLNSNKTFFAKISNVNEVIVR